MSSISFVKALVVQINEQQLFASGGVKRNIPCGPMTEVLDLYWAYPITSNGILQYYWYQIGGSRPTVDAVNVLRVKDNSSGQTYFIALQDSQNAGTFTSACNGCCGSTPDISTGVVIPPIDAEICICPDVTTTDTYTFKAPIPANPNSLTLSLVGSFNNAAGTPAPNASYADAAAILTWVQANWSAYGTWSLQATNTLLQLVTTTVTCANIDIELIPAVYCFTYPAASTTVDGIKIGGSIVTFPAITFTNATPQALVDAISPYLIGTLDSTSIAGKLQYTGLQVPDNLTYQGSDVANTSFTGGACTGNTFNSTIPSITGGQHYHVTQPNFNGVAATPDITGQAFVDAPAMLTWVQANWAAYGTWSLQSGNTVLRLVSTTVYSESNLTITAS
jgi:hypothetical protein